jgi:hypothetical protein
VLYETDPSVNEIPTGCAQPPSIFLPLRPANESQTPEVILEWIRAKTPEHDGRLYFRISDVCSRFDAPKMFYYVVNALYRQGMIEVERWRLERLGDSKWSQTELIYVITPLDLARPTAFECYAPKTPKPVFSTEERREIWQRFNGTCLYCDKPVGVEDMAVDHGLPRSRGGTSDESNLICACHPCNNAKRTQTTEEYLAFIVGAHRG